MDDQAIGIRYALAEMTLFAIASLLWGLISRQHILHEYGFFLLIVGGAALIGWTLLLKGYTREKTAEHQRGLG